MMSPASIEPARSTNMAERWLLWVDGAGGFIVLGGDHWAIGGPSARMDSSIAVQADLKRREAELYYNGDDYFVRALDGQVQMEEAAESSFCLLRSSDQFVLGSDTQFGFRVPHPLSHSAVLTVHQRNRFFPHVDGVLLQTDTILIGPASSCHIVAPFAEHPVALFRRGPTWVCQPLGNVGTIPPTAYAEKIELGKQMSMFGIALTLEPL